MGSKLLRYSNALSYIAMIAVNMLAQRGVIGGQTTGQVSAKYPTIMTPAGYAFSIWLLIYAALAGFIVYSFTARGKQDNVVRSVGIYFVLSCILNCSWLLLWHMEYIVSSNFIIYALFLSLLIIVLNIHKAIKNTIYGQHNLSKWFVCIPFAIYIGWIAVASLVNTAVTLTYGGWQPLTTGGIAVVLLAAAVVLAYVLGLAFRSWVTMLVIVWGLVAIAVEQRQHSWMVGLTVGVIALIVTGIILLVRWLTNRNKAIKG